MVKTIINKFLYAILFIVLIPSYLGWLSYKIDIGLPAYHVPEAGVLLVIIGGGLLLAGMADLFYKGKGLPMNAYPPKQLVLNGIYAFIPHPIYCGFVLIIAGLPLYFGSATGLWLITPLAIFGCLSLVWGYERIYLVQTFKQLPSPWLGMPSGGNLFRRLGAFFALFVPWLIIYEAFVLVGAPADAVDTHLAFEWHIPVWVWSYPIYASAYGFVSLPFIVCQTKDLKYFFCVGWLSIAVMSLFYIAIPAVATPRLMPTLSGSDSAVYLLLYQLLSFEMKHAAPYTAAFPSYHVVWAVLVALILSRVSRLWAWIGWIWCGLIIISCFTTGMHSVLDLVSGVFVGLLLFKASALWNAFIRWANTLANSYHSKRIGVIRVMSHFKYSLAAGFMLVFLTTLLLGAQYAKLIVLMGCVGLLGAVLWGWLVEGAAVSMRPLGYFGSVLLFLIVNIALLLLGYNTWPFIAALFCAAPFAHVVGRFRCVIQGCCHGRVVHEHETARGFCVSIPNSRVVSLSCLQNQLIYPTQIYSMLGNIALGIVLLRLWTLQVNISLLIGLYLVFAGFLRFIEEGYRGEIQTPKYFGLASYQWLSLLFILMGSFIMTVDLNMAPAIPRYEALDLLKIAIWALLGGLIGGFVGSVDFPDSNKPFSRLER